MAKDYRGGYWEFYTLSNGGFYLAPSPDRVFHVSCDNFFEGYLTADARGITACLYAYSHLSFAGPAVFADICADHHHRLREYMFEHPEVRAILGAAD
jgi:Antirestriction protein